MEAICSSETSIDFHVYPSRAKHRQNKWQSVLPWRWRWHVPPKRWLIFNGIHAVSQPSKKTPWKHVAISSTLEMEATWSSETSVDFQRNTWCYIPAEQETTVKTCGNQFYPEDRSDMFLRNVGWFSIQYIVLYPSRARNHRENMWQPILPWRWKRHVPPKLRLIFNTIHGVISQSSKKPPWKHVAISSILKMEATCSSETSVYFQRNAWCYIPAEQETTVETCGNQFYPEDEGDMFLRNISWFSVDYTALYSRSWYYPYCNILSTLS
jgi:uncharacterized membrane protein